MSACQPDPQHPHIKLNPHPKVRYEITLTTKDAPGSFDSVEGYMSYEVANKQCAPFEKFVGIYRAPTGKHLPLLLIRITPHEYKGFAYLDLLQDEDYYGLGVCHWQIQNVGAQLKAGKMAFSPYLSRDQVITQQLSIQYFHKREYGDDASNVGTSSARIPSTPAAEYLEQHPDKRFEITMIAKESFE